MMRMIAILALFAASLPLAASYSIALPDKRNPEYQVIADNGDTIDLDDYVWSKRWNGVQLSQDSYGSYIIEDGEYTVLLTSPVTSWDDIEMSVRFCYPSPSLLALHSGDIDAEFLKDEGINEILFVSYRPQGREKARLDALGFTIHEARPGEVARIDNGISLPSESEAVSVRCPHCGEVFTLYF